MRFNSARPIKALTPKEQEGLRKILFPTEQREVSTRKLPIDPITPVTQGTPPRHPGIPWDDPGAVAAYLQPAAAPANGQRQHEANSSENQERSVEGPEIAALILTFGEDVGEFLIGRIKIKIVDDLPVRARVPYRVNGKRNVSEIHLRGDYNDQDLGWLGMFIHEATHIWQKNTGLHQGTSWLPDRSRRDYEYTLDQLHSLNLNQEEHALAVQEWFIANYAYTYGLIGDAPGQALARFVWGGPYQVLGIHPDYYDPEIPDKDIPVSARIWMINVHYERLINQIQDPTLLPPSVTKLGQNIPNPFD